jgi:glycosyltransferase involved in cell wall biosynthesis
VRIALVAGEDPGWGGIGTYTGVLGHALSDLGHEVVLVLRGWEEDGEETLDGLRVHRVTVPEPSWRRGTTTPSARFYSTREAIVFARGVMRAIEPIDPDVVEAPEFGAPALLAAIRSRGRLHRPSRVIVRLHTPSFLTARFAQAPPGADGRALETLEALAVHSAALVSSPSEALAHLVAKRWLVPSTRLRVIPNPIDEKSFCPGSEVPVPGRILIVGRVERLKGHDVLLEALPTIRSAVPEAHVLAIGEDGGLTERLTERAAVLGVTDAVSFAGPRPRAELPAAYRAATVCVVPSRFENFPYTAVEAMGCGRAVIAARAGGLPEVVVAGQSGLLVAPEDPADLAAAVVDLLRDPGRRATLEAGARQRAAGVYGSRRVAEQMVETYAEGTRWPTGS